MNPADLKPSIPARAAFRDDINGLRAWAVVAVVLYHFGVPGFGGGFIGVDVFFVISGFLMTGIVVRGLERGSFSLIDFYMARARRIIPALAVLCLVLVTLGWFMLLPPDYKQMSTHAGYSLSFLSNIEYFREAGYFDSASHEKWLLHTWSLSVEWQFYMVLPIILWAAWRIRAGRAVQGWLIAAGFIASFAASVLVTRADPSAAFFLLHTRAWEMLGGGLVLLYGQRLALGDSARAWFERLGLLLIAASIVVFDKHSIWPGYLAMVPVAAAMLVLTANGTSAFTGNRVAQWLGDRSYSLYLWHWPVCVALVYAEAERSPLAIAGGMVLTLVLGHLSYHLVEVRSRRWLGKGNWRAGVVLVAGVLVALAPVLYVWRGAGIPGRFPAATELAAAESGNFNPRRAACHASTGVTSPMCRFGAAAPARHVLLVGDSHASVLVSALKNAAHGANAGVVLMSYSGCPYLPGMKMRDDFLAGLPGTYQCTRFNDWVQEQIAASPVDTPVVMANRFAGAAIGTNESPDKQVPSGYFSLPYTSATPELLREFSANIVRTACQASAGGRRVYLVRPVPEIGKNVPKISSRRMSLGLDGEVSIPLAAYQARNGWVWAAQDEAVRRCGATIIDPTALLCRDGRCLGTHAGRPMYFDDDHLSEYGNARLQLLFAPVFATAGGGR